MSTRQWIPPEFAFRYHEIEPTEAWRANGDNFERPPRRYRKKPGGFNKPWHSWTASLSLGERTKLLTEPCILKRREATSITWCQESQAFWVAPGDLTDPHFRDNENEHHDWGPIWFNKLSPQSPDTRSVYRIATWGHIRQLNYPCPPGFEEYLHDTKFRNVDVDGPVHCRLVGRLSLILALHAMCPQDPRNILAQIALCFWPGYSPDYIPTTLVPRWNPRDKRG